MGNFWMIRRCPLKSTEDLPKLRACMMVLEEGHVDETTLEDGRLVGFFFLLFWLFVAFFLHSFPYGAFCKNLNYWAL